MKLYIYDNNEFWHKCIAPLYRCVYQIDNGFYKCPVCSFKFPSILTLGSEKVKNITKLFKFIDETKYIQFGFIPSIHDDQFENRDEVEGYKSFLKDKIKVVDV